MPQSVLRIRSRARRALLASLLAVCSVLGLALSPLLAGGPAVAAALTPAHHGPTKAELKASRALVHTRLSQLARAERRLGRAKASMAHAEQAAELASEAYNAAHIKLVTARQQVVADRKTLAAAQHTFSHAQRQAAGFAVAAYEGGYSNTVDIVSEKGPGEVVQRLGAVQAIAVTQQQVMQKLRAAQVVQATVTEQAQQATAAAQVAASQARDAFGQARKLAAAAQRSFNAVQRERHRVTTLLSEAKSHASALRREHIRAVARAEARARRRAEAAAAAAEPPPSVPTAPPPPPPATSGTVVSAATEARALQYAESQEGKPYQWGAAGPNTYDCSGLTMWAYAHVGVGLLHYTGDQWVEGEHIPLSQLRPGDLVFFAYNTSDPSTIHHVGMYAGNGTMVNAPYTGVDVRIDSINQPGLIGAVRPYQN